jgi:hypothetical protein
MPAPHRPLFAGIAQAVPAAKGRAEFRTAEINSVRVKKEFNDSINAIVPDTCGTAMLVPRFNA